MSQFSDPMLPSRPARVRLEALADAWQLMKPNLLAWIGATLIALVCGAVVCGALFVFEFANAIRSAALRGIGRPSIGATLVLDVALALLQALLIGGMTRMAIRQARGEAVQVGDVFGATDVYGRVFVFMLALSLIGTLIGYLPFGGVVSILAGLILQGLLLFAVPLIVDQHLDVMEAVRRSVETVRGQLPMAILFMFIIGLLAGVGTTLCIVPALFTIPLGISAIGVLYQDFFGAPPATGSIAPTESPAPSM